MCGICGIISYNHSYSVNIATIRRMCTAMNHRGPDDEGIYIDNKEYSVGLGHRRLSIIDLSKSAHQPMSNEDETAWIVFNGEIYNYKDLRLELEKKGHKFKSMSDTETILHLYEDVGVDCVRYLRGMFAFAIWDVKQRHLFLARDRLGKKPLIYYYKDGIFHFASEFSSLLAGGFIKREINNEAISYYLSLGYIPAPLSIYNNVFKLPPAHVLILKNKGLVVERYWHLDYVKKIKISEEDARIEILRLLEEAVKIRLYSDVPLGSFLSGGIDSSIVVALMSKLCKDKINTFSIGFEDSNYNELPYAREVARRYNTNHHEFVVKPETLELLPNLVGHFGEPFADSSCVPTYYVSKLTRQYVTVALNGDGGDEAFAGYDRYSAVLFAEKYHHIPLPIRKLLRFIAMSLPAKEEPKDAIKRLKRFFSGADFAIFERYFYWTGIFSRLEKERLVSDEFKSKLNLNTEQALKSFLGDFSNIELIDMLLRIDTLTYLPDDLLVKVDITTMANSLEARSPFLDHKFVEFVASLPVKYKIHRGIKKFILKKVAKNLLPPKNIHRKKMGFGVPITNWLRDEMKDYLEANLLGSKCLNRGYFKPAAIKELLDAHTKGKVDYGAKLWALLMLELWHQRFID